MSTFAVKRIRLILAALIVLFLTAIPAQALADAYSGWLWPVTPSYRHMSRGYFNGHEAIDIPVGVGNSIYASKDGIVIVVFDGCNRSFTTGSYQSCSWSTCNPTAGYYNWNNGAQGSRNGLFTNFKLYNSNGEVIADYNRCNSGYGRGVVVYHPSDNAVTSYAHMNTVSVSPGQTVKQGDVIGTSGARGNAFGAHLHYQIGLYPKAGTVWPTSTWVNSNPNSHALGITCANTTNMSYYNGYAYNSSGVSYVFDTIKRGYLDVNGLLDGAQSGTLGSAGKVDVYINGALDADNVSDYYKQWPVGTSYEIREVHAEDGYAYDGVKEGSLSGKISSEAGVNVRLSFISARKLTVSGRLDGEALSSTEGFGTFDVYIDGQADAQNVTSYGKSWPVGTKYEIRNVQSAEGKTFDGVYAGSISGTIGQEHSDIALAFTSNGTATVDWQTGYALPGNLDTELLDVEYDNIYEKKAMTSPGEGYEKAELVSSEWVNDNLVTSLRPMTTSDTLVDKGWYYFHFCAGSKPEYANYTQDSTYVHYDSIPNASNTVVVGSGPDGTDPSITYYTLNWQDGSKAYCSSGVTCDGSNGSHGNRSRVWYRHYTYQVRHKEDVYRWVKSTGWTDAADKAATRTMVRWRLKGGIALTPENITGIVAPDQIILTAGDSMQLELGVVPAGIDAGVLECAIDHADVAVLDENLHLTALYSPERSTAVLTVSAPNGVSKAIPILVDSNLVSEQWSISGYAPGTNEGRVDVFAAGQPVAFSYSYELTNEYDPGYRIAFMTDGGVSASAEGSSLVFTGSGLCSVIGKTNLAQQSFGRVLVTEEGLSMILPQGTQIIGDDAFANVQARFFYLPESVRKIGGNAFPEGSFVFLYASSVDSVGSNPGVYYVEAGSVYSNAFAAGRRDRYLAQRGTVVLPEWTDWSDWSEEPVVGSDTVEVETRKQYRLAPVTTSVVYGDWSAWSGWSGSRQSIDDSELKQEQTRTVYPYYYFICPACGAHLPYWGNRTCYACGQYVNVPEGSFSIDVYNITVPKSGCAQYDSIKYYTTWNGKRYYYWDDGSSSMQTPKTQYSYRTRTRSNVNNVGEFGEWTDGEWSRTEGFTAETRTLYRWREKQ